MTNSDGVISTRQAAKLLGVSVRTVQLWVENGSLKAWKTAGNHRRIYQSSIDRMIRQRAGESLRVLIVEDDPALQAYYENLFDLVEPKLHTELASNGFEALVKMGSNPPDLAIVDIEMPYMNGLEMIESIRHTKLLETVSIAIVTGLDDEQIRSRGKPPADINVYSKPLSVVAFQEILELLPRIGYTFSSCPERECHPGGAGVYRNS